MELKHPNMLEAMLTRVLLIVPYGIETEETRPESKARQLLIVPYGIETLPP